MLCDESNHGRAVANAPDKIEEQRKFVAWWDGAVERKGGDEKRKPRTRLSVIDAQDLTGMKQQRVSDLGQEHVAAAALLGRSCQRCELRARWLLCQTDDTGPRYGWRGSAAGARAESRESIRSRHVIRSDD